MKILNLFTHNITISKDYLSNFLYLFADFQTKNEIQFTASFTFKFFEFIRKELCKRTKLSEDSFSEFLVHTTRGFVQHN